MGRDSKDRPTQVYTKQMDAEGLGRELLLTPLRTPPPPNSLKSRL